MENIVFDISVSMCGEPRLSESQPVNVGFGFVIFLPKENFDRALSVKVNHFRTRGMIVRKERPVFLRTERDYIRLSFLYGDSETATEAFDYFGAFTKMIFKNWLTLPF